jgi:hypothetical protein
MQIFIDIFYDNVFVAAAASVVAFSASLSRESQLANKNFLM